MEAIQHYELPKSNSSLNDITDLSAASVTEASSTAVLLEVAEQKRVTRSLSASESEVSLKTGKSYEAYQNELQSSEQAPWKNCHVVIRIHPQEKNNDEAKKCIQAECPRRIVINTGRGHQPHALDFDAVLDENASQKDVYDSVAKPLVEFVLQGYNGCIITYGTPGSGKTYTLQGGNLSGKPRGIISRAAEEIFNNIEKASCRITASYIQISNEKIYDLLANEHSDKIRIHESDDNVSVEGLVEVVVTSVESLLQVFRKGTLNRNAGMSKGDFSNRNHTLFYITVVHTNIIAEKSQEKYITAGKLTLVDLSGSGRANNRGGNTESEHGKKCFMNVSETNQHEAKNVKRSLTLFGNVVFALSTPGCQHIPYRESKLTRILRDCLGGNCLMSLVVTVSSSSASVHETLSTLQFAARARSITNHAGKNIQLQSSKDQASPLQTCLPPIHAGRSASSRPTEKSLRDSVLRLDEAKEHPSQRVVLPHLEKASEKALKTVRAVTNSDKSKGADDRFRNLRSRPNPLVGSVDVLRENKMEKQQHKLDKISGFEPSSAKAFTETIPFEIQKNAECANCKKEKKIRDEYDKFILQSKRDKESLQQRIVELEAELTKPQQEVEELAPAAQKEVREIVDKLSCLMSKSEQNKLEEENRGKQKQIEHLENEVEHLQKSLKYYQKLAADEKEIHQTYIIQLQQDELLHTAILQERNDLLVEVEQLKIQLDKNRDNERIQAQRRNAEKYRLILEIEKLKSQLEEVKERENRKIDDLKNEKESIHLELEVTKNELEKLRKTQNEKEIKQKREKDGFLVEIEELQNCLDKVKAENCSLQSTIGAFHKERRSDPQPSFAMSTVTTNTEMLMIAHQISQKGTMALNADCRHCFFGGCATTNLSLSTSAGKHSETAGSTVDSAKEHNEITEIKEMYKQLKRERNLLLDVMVIMYTRRWFVAEAMPHIKRTLTKCGIISEDAD